jgi:hypothetical protein
VLAGCCRVGLRVAPPFTEVDILPGTRALSRSASARPWIAPVCLAGLAAYTFLMRAHGITDHFLMLGDQIRDWSIALRPFSGLPRVGTSSTAGGYSFGPVFYWVLWLIRVTIGPFMDNLPHAGGLGLAALQSCSDAVLCAGIRRASGSWTFALAAVLIVASSPFDAALSSVIWNPVLAVALAKAATGLVLSWREALTLPRRVVLFVLAWLAVQAHSAAMPVAIAVFLWVFAVRFRDGGARTLVRAAASAGAVVLLLQIPAALASESIQPTRVVASVRHPDRIRLVDSLGAVSGAVGSIALAPWSVPNVQLILLGAGTALWVATGTAAAPVAVTVVPLAAAVLLWSLWQHAYDSYLFLTLVPAAVLMVLWVLRLLPGEAARSVAAAILLAIAVLVQPRRLANAAQLFRLPGYGALVRGSRAVVARGEPMRSIDAPFLPPTSNPEFVYEILGGRINRHAPLAARLSATGEVVYVH